MRKAEALSRAKAARQAATVAQATVALYSLSFGSSDPLVQQAMLDADVAVEVAQKWERFAAMHSSTRSRLIRTGSLPVYMFAY